MLDIDENTLQIALKHLKQGMHNHESWHKEISRTVVGRLPCDQRDIAKEAHRKCSFGLWYYNELPPVLRNHPSFAAIRLAHKDIHESASKLLHKLSTEETLHLGDYDNFTASLEAFCLAVKVLERKIEGLIYHYDPLTGTGTRAIMLAEMPKLYKLAAEQIQSCCIVFMNFNQLKFIYEIYGHELGDQVLVAAIRFIKKHLRPFDSIFHYGNDSFIISMPITDLSTARTVLERVHGKLALFPLAYRESNPIFMTATFGLTLLETGRNIDENIQRARHAAQVAQSTGSNNIQIWDISIPADKI
ncbi:MAG: diguanylate cyclase domain-containing protein [Sulfuriferula sp.]